MATIKKAQAGITAKKKTFKSNPDSGGNVPMPQGRKGTPMPPKGLSGKAKNGKSFPDLNKDGKITKADVLKGRGVIAKSGAKMKKKCDACK